jgi:hypothetical protein
MRKGSGRAVCARAQFSGAPHLYVRQRTDGLDLKDG